MTDNKLTVSVEEAADLLGIGKTSAWSLVGQNRLPVLRLNGRVRVPVKALESWATERALASLENEDGQAAEPRLTVQEGGRGTGRRSRSV